MIREAQPLWVIDDDDLAFFLKMETQPHFVSTATNNTYELTRLLPEYVF